MLEDLIEFVAHSNRIKGEPDELGHPLFDDHLKVARSVANARSPWRPQAIHRRLMRSEPEKFPGEYRQVRVQVGGAEKMRPVEVRPAMADLLRITHGYPRDYRMRSEAAYWGYHYEFERIHPFIDGNGRTGRLWLNALRLAAGLPWLTVRFEERWDYYQAIRDFEATQAGAAP